MSLLFFLAGYNACAFDAGLSVQVDERMRDEKIVSILNKAKMTELNKLSPDIKKTLILKLYKIPFSGSCVPETHMTCGYEYYLAVSEYDEMPDQAVWYFGKVGEITAIEWLKQDEVDKALIKFKVRNYPALALERNPDLPKKEKTVTLDVSVNAVRIKKSD